MSVNSKKKNILILAGIFFLATLLYFIYQHQIFVVTDDAQIQGHTFMISSKVSGYIEAVNIKEGVRVKKDDILIEIDPRDYQTTLMQMESELASIEARKKDVETNYRRMESLYSTNSISQQQFDTIKASKTELTAKYQAISMQVSQAKLNLENTKIKAPSDGFIAKKSVEKGQYAGQGVPLLGFVSDEGRWVTANFKETEIEDLKVGNSVEISVDAITNKTFKGKVESVSLATGATFTLLPPDNATGNFTKVVQRIPVHIQFESLMPEDKNLLIVGLSANVKVNIKGTP